MTITSTYIVEGMSCGHCVVAVTEELSQLAGVRLVDVDLGSGRVTVESNDALDDAEVAAAIDEAGYTVSA
jgi:copper chaperone CopZ